MGCVFTPALSDGVFPSSQGRSVWTRNYKCFAISAARRPVAAAGAAGWSSAGGAFPNGFKSAAADLKAQYKQQDAWEENRLATSRSPGPVTSCSLRATGGRRRAANPAPPSPYLLAVRDVPGVLMDTWVEEPSPTRRCSTGDVDGRSRTRCSCR